ncbi:MAG: ABC transporter substrate-binding protein [Gammaproteobacteria bacterium]|nr:ABC transporter substrate-binding protein [Gammaproteobacteria bacterium]
MSGRLPENPRIMQISKNGLTAGKYGGVMRMLMGKEKDIRRMVVFGYSRLVGFDLNLELTADILESYEVREGREFIFRLRKGHRWSDGQPFTSDDFRFYWEDVANNDDLFPFGPPKTFRVEGDLPIVEYPDEWTVVYRWNRPNPHFLIELASPRPLFIYMPRHYLESFHPRYADREALDEQAKSRGSRNWSGYFLKKARQYRLTNPELPSLQPWVNTISPPAERYVFKRNPYFHRVDENRLQLPYIDQVQVNIVSSSLIPAKTGAGESDLQGHYLRLDNFTFLKEGEQRNGYDVLLWKTLNGSHKALYPNLNSRDEEWRNLARDVRFRRALSLAVNRREVNQVIYYGLANESSNTVLPGSVFYEDEMQTWARYDLEEANALLDSLGLDERNKRGLRLMPDGRPLEVIIHTAGESTEETDILELIHDSLLKVGIKVYTKPSQREVFRDRIFSGDVMMSVWTGLENAMPTSGFSPGELAPTSQNQYQWSRWGQYHETNGKAGEKPDLPSVRRLYELYLKWSEITDVQQRQEIWREMLRIYTDEVFNIGIVNAVPQPIVVNGRLRNVPIEGLYAWFPTSYFGVYSPDTFWFDE